MWIQEIPQARTASFVYSLASININQTEVALERIYFFYIWFTLKALYRVRLEEVLEFLQKINVKQTLRDTICDFFAIRNA